MIDSRAFFLLLILAVSVSLGCNEVVSIETEPFPEIENPTPEEALEMLREASGLAGASVGIDGTTSRQVRAFRVVLREAYADQAFKQLLNEATKSGQLYALAGLYFTDPAYMNEAARVFLNDHSEVETYFGCIVDEQPVSRLTAEIVDGTLPRSFGSEVVR